MHDLQIQRIWRAGEQSSPDVVVNVGDLLEIIDFKSRLSQAQGDRNHRFRIRSWPFLLIFTK